jgi:hypothetical protein
VRRRRNDDHDIFPSDELERRTTRADGNIRESDSDEKFFPRGEVNAMEDVEKKCCKRRD